MDFYVWSEFVALSQWNAVVSCFLLGLQLFGRVFSDAIPSPRVGSQGGEWIQEGDAPP